MPKTDLAFLAATVVSSNEEDAESAESGMAPDSMPRGPMHWAGTLKKMLIFLWGIGIIYKIKLT